MGACGIDRPSVHPPSVEYLSRSRASRGVSFLNGSNLDEALARAESFWREATSGHRDHVHKNPFLNLLVYKETVLPGVFGKIDLYACVLLCV